MPPLSLTLQPSDEDEETRAYRLEIEKQKQLREKIMRDKEMKRRRAAEEKQHEVSSKIPYITQSCTVSLRSSQRKIPNKFSILVSKTKAATVYFNYLMYMYIYFVPILHRVLYRLKNQN